MKIILAITLAALVLFAAACGSDDPPCVGHVTDKFTTYDPGVSINVGGNKNGGGGIGVPVGNGTRYHLAIDREDGSSCDRKVKKSVWLGTHEGDTFPKAAAQ